MTVENIYMIFRSSFWVTTRYGGNTLKEFFHANILPYSEEHHEIL